MMCKRLTSPAQRFCLNRRFLQQVSPFPTAQSTAVHFGGSFPISYPHFRSVCSVAGLFWGGYEALGVLKWLLQHHRRGAVPLVSLLRVQNLPACEERQIKRKGSSRAAGSAPPSEHPHLQLGFFLGSSGDLHPAQRLLSPRPLPGEIPSPSPSSPGCEGITAAE